MKGIITSLHIMYRTALVLRPTVGDHVQVALRDVEWLYGVEGLCQDRLKVEASPVTLQLLQRLLPLECIPGSLEV